MRNKTSKLLVTFLLVIVFLFGCTTSDKDEFFNSMQEIGNMDSNAYQIEIKTQVDNPEELLFFKDYAFLFYNQAGKYVCNFKIEGVIDEVNASLTEAEIAYQIGDMTDYKVLTDVVLKESVLYINEKKLVNAIGEMLPEYKVFLDRIPIADTKYLAYDISQYLQQLNAKYNNNNQEVNNSKDFINIMPAAGTQIVRFIEAALPSIEDTAYQKDGKTISLQIQGTEIANAYDGILRELDDCEQYYDNFIKDLKENSNIDKLIIEEYEKSKDNFLAFSQSKRDALSNNKEEVIANLENNESTINVVVTKSGDREGTIGYSFQSKSKTVSLTTTLSNKKTTTITIPEDVEDLNAVLNQIEFFVE